MRVYYEERGSICAMGDLNFHLCATSRYSLINERKERGEKIPKGKEEREGKKMLLRVG